MLSTCIRSSRSRRVEGTLRASPTSPRVQVCGMRELCAGSCERSYSRVRSRCAVLCPSIRSLHVYVVLRGERTSERLERNPNSEKWKMAVRLPHWQFRDSFDVSAVLMVLRKKINQKCLMRNSTRFSPRRSIPSGASATTRVRTAIYGTSSLTLLAPASSGPLIRDR